MSQNTPIAYTSVQDIVKLINLQQSTVDPNKYLVWQIPTSVDILNTFVQYANEQATQLFGDRTKGDSLGLTKQWATWKAVQNMINTMTINWVISGLPVAVGTIGFDRLAAMQAASVGVKEQAALELFRLYTMLSEIEPVQNYQPSSPYIAMGGQRNFG